jgi:hypothetical protein
MLNKLNQRNLIISKASKKYIPSHTKNISKALELYLKNDAGEDEQIPLTITKKTKPKNIADLIGRPICPGCKQEMMLRIINTSQGKANLRGWKTCWECINCGYEEYSKKTIDNLLEEVKKPEK